MLQNVDISKLHQMFQVHLLLPMLIQ
ncbi:uncharacterized protein METZ01_LOCUS8883 [marine metagenome]|uniref:Uncharacterized protein n=1 Tax=marine metagenome TaxID=408172 RepID=A0A381NNV2_9ZZZZ